MDTGIKGEEVTVAFHEMECECHDCKPLPHLEAQIRDIQFALAAVLRDVGMPDNAQRFIEKAAGPDCALCGEPCHNSFRTDTNVHQDCWREEKTG